MQKNPRLNSFDEKINKILSGGNGKEKKEIVGRTSPLFHKKQVINVKSVKPNYNFSHKTVKLKKIIRHDESEKNENLPINSQVILNKPKPLISHPELLRDKDAMSTIVTMPSDDEDSDVNLHSSEELSDKFEEINKGNNQEFEDDKENSEEVEQEQEKYSEQKKVSEEKIGASSKQVAVKLDNDLNTTDVEIAQEKINGNIIDSYTIKLDGASADIRVIKNDVGVKYTVNTPKISMATAVLLNDLREELISITSVSMQELIDPKAFSSIKKRFKEEAAKIIRKKIPTIKDETESFLVGTLMQEMLGIGKIEYLINDPNLEEIVIVSAKEPIKIYNKKYGWLSTNIILEKEEVTMNYSNIIARRVGRQITVLSPLLDAHLVTGDRVNAVLYPINTKGNTITIRKFARDPYTIIDLINNKTCDLDAAALLWLAIEYEMNVMISGGTASGKTVLLNACMPFIPPNQRIISIEDTKELALPEFLYWTPLVTRLPNAEGKGAVTMLDLLINSLRMRPDRIILGEMRKHDEAMVLFEAMHTGHSVYATLHADSAAETISRLIHPPLDIPANLLEAIHLNVVMFRDRKRGIRRILQIAEIETEGDTAKANTLYRWSPESDKLVRHSKSSKFFEQIGRHTSMSEEDINKDLIVKKNILVWLMDHKIRNMEDIGKTMNLYYQNKDLLVKKISKNDVNFILSYGK